VKKNKIKAVTANLVLAEAVWTLLSFYSVERAGAIEAVEGIANLRGLKLVDGYQVAEALRLFNNRRVKFIDAMLASILEVQEKKWTVVSYDKDFSKIKSVVVQNPKELLETFTPKYKT